MYTNTNMCFCWLLINSRFSAPIKLANGFLSTWHTPSLLASEVYETPGIPVEPDNFLTEKIFLHGEIKLADP